MTVGQPMAFAGLREGLKWPDGTVTWTFTIITTNANAMIAELHDRMNHTFAAVGWERRKSILRRCCEPGDDVLMVWPVSKQSEE
jgi:putative SOS response-associated peptidase YedK